MHLKNKWMWLLALPYLIDGSTTTAFRHPNDEDLRIDVPGQQRGDLYCIDLKDNGFTSCQDIPNHEPFCIKVRTLCVKTNWRKK